MWSLRQTLTSIGPHLPDGFSAAAGIRSLFPPGRTTGISVLSRYVYTWTADAFVDQQWIETGWPGPAQGFLGADGAGRWFYGWVPPDQENPCWGSAGGFKQRAQSGFVFLYSTDGNAHGIVAKSRSVPNPYAYPPNCYCGVDSWLAANWPDVFSQGAHIEFEIASGFSSLPNVSAIWTSAGFGHSNFRSLEGSQCTCAVTGSSVFPFSSFPDPTGPENDSSLTWEAWTLLDYFIDWWETGI